jgi:hypothetical protein
MGGPENEVEVSRRAIGGRVLNGWESRAGGGNAVRSLACGRCMGDTARCVAAGQAEAGRRRSGAGGDDVGGSRVGGC